MAGKQNFGGRFRSESYQLNGNHFHGPTFLNTTESKFKDNLSDIHSNPRKNLTEHNRDGDDKRFEPGLEENISWDDCLRSLALGDLISRERLINREADGTYLWLLKTSQYSRWVNEHGLLLIRGNPGCGKSTLLKFALRKQEEDAAFSKAIVLSFFFYSSGTELQTSTEGLFRTLFLQLFDQDDNSKATFQDICRKRWIETGKSNTQFTWHQTELRDSFEKLVLDCSRRHKTTILVDAIDECRDQDRDDLIRFFHSLKGQSQLRSKRPAIFFTCRLYPDGPIDADFQIRLEEETRDDIPKFITQELRLPDETERAKDNLKELLQTKANGLFLWLFLIIRQIHEMSNKGLSMKIIESRISECPKELDGLYEDLLKKIENNELRETTILFQWICFTSRPLSLDELRTAMTVHLSGPKSSLNEYEDESNPYCISNDRKMKTRMIYLSRGLVDIANSDLAKDKPVVGFHHDTIKSFILTKGLKYLYNRLAELQGLNYLTQDLAKKAHLQLANTCLNYLSTREIGTTFSEKQIKSLSQFFFLHYTTENWLTHAIKAEKDGYGEKINWPSQDVLDTWVRIFQVQDIDAKDYPKEGISLLHIAAEYGLPRLAESICKRDKHQIAISTKIGPKRMKGKPKSKHVTDGKKQGLMKTSSSRGGNENTRAISTTRTLNQQRMKRESVTQERLYRSKTDFNSGSLRQIADFIQKITEKEKGFQKTDDCRVEVTKEQSTVMNRKDKEGNVPLHQAALKGHLKIVEILKRYGAEIHTTNTKHCTAFLLATANGHIEVVKFLYEYGADIHTANNNGWTPLNIASYNGHIEMVKFLYENGADIHIATNNGWTPLNSASNNGHIEVVKFLYENGADIHIATKDGRTPLNSASNNGHIEMIKFLYENGADIHAATKDGWTPLNSASNNGHIEVIKFLYKHGADIHIATNNGWTPLNSASSNGHIEVVKFLYKHGADIHIVTKDGWTPLNSTSYNGYIEVVKFLYEHGADTDIHTATNNGWTPLNAASDSGHIEAVKFLYENGADTDIHTATNNGWTPLNSASNNGHIEVVKFLYEHGADTDIHTATNNGWTPLNSASSNGYIEVVKFLYKHGADADIHVATKDGWTPLNSASNNGHIEVVKFLYEHGADTDIHTATNNGWTPLNSASSNDHIEVVKFLSGISEVYALDTDKNGRTALFFAAMRGHNKLVRLLYTKYPSSIHIKDNYSATPLFAASRNGHVEVVKFLLDADHTYIDSKDCFGRTWIWWAKRSGNSQLVDLIHQHADTVGLQIEEDNASAERALVLYDSTSAWCDVCTLSIPDGSDYYQCGICDSGNFCICLECFKFGVKCQNASHIYELSNSKGSVGV
ncbi:hypothetical protein OCU04_012668 [Sclerotinia nivalis]|uniref:Nephrocystin 3-like N-terminal domain-containing protein n=1 Tax=Sclerotinia nivalis TaxID=352851 RepID=A0A9X0A917_9HELO|nr:hypothetical protein OCU04_012668 [Sclerotinia nivalis]